MIWKLSYVLITLLIPRVYSALTWRKLQVNGSPPLSRRDVGFGYWAEGNSLVLFGGRTGAREQDTWLFDLDTEQWKKIYPTNKPERRYSMVSGVLQKQSLFIVSLGQGPDPSTPLSADDQIKYNDVWALDLRDRTWTRLSVSNEGPSERYGGHGGTHVDSSHFWVGGGFAPDHRRHSDTFRIDFSLYNRTVNMTSLSWELVDPGAANFNQYNPFTPHARCLHASTLSSPSDLFIFGGCMSGGRAGGPCPTQDSWHYSLQSRSWSQLPFCSSGRAYAAMAPLDSNTVVLYGGIDAMNRQTIYQTLDRYPEDELIVLNVENNRWTRYRSLPDPDHRYPERREGHAMVSDGNGSIYMFGGRDIYNDVYFNDIWLLSGNLSDQEVLGSCSVVWFTWVHMHGLLNSIAWGFILPSGVLVARYYRKKGSTAWFWAHRILQMTGLVFTLVAAIMIFAVSSTPTFPHAIIGILLLVGVSQQPINGILRPHKKEEEPKSKRRACWEAWHKTIGYLCVALGLVNSTLGHLLIVGPPAVWITWVVLVGVWVLLFIIHEIKHWYKSYKSSLYKIEQLKNDIVSPENKESLEAQGTSISNSIPETVPLTNFNGGNTI